MMRGFQRHLAKGLVPVIMMMLLLVMITPVLAVSTVEEQTLVTPITPDSDSHGYVYMPAGTNLYGGTHEVYHTSPISLASYQYDQATWTTETQSFPVESTNRYSYTEPRTENQGWLGNYTQYPIFFDITNTSMDSWIANLTERRYVFGAQMDADVFVLAEENEYTYGTLSIAAGIEFVHLIVTSGSDWYEGYLSIFDPLGRMIVDNWGLDSGDITLIPFPVTIPGQYVILFWGYSDYDVQIPLTFHPKTVTPTTIANGEVYQDAIEGVEIIVDQETGDFIYREKEPQARTYKVSTTDDMEGLLRLTSNPSLDIFMPTDVKILVQSPVFEPTSDGFTIFQNELDWAQGRYYYKSFQDEAYYVTYVGHGEFPYTISNRIVDLPSLQTNTPLYYEDKGSEMHAYSFSVTTPTLFRVNHTSIAGSFSLKLWRVDGGMYYRDLSPTSNGNFGDSSSYYIAPGEYILTVEGGVNPDNIRFIEFNTAPVLSSGLGLAVPLGGLGGYRTTLTELGWWMMNVSLLNKDNITVRYDIELFNEYGNRILQTSDTTANHQTNGEWVGYSGSNNKTEFNVPWDYNEDVIVCLSVYDVENNSFSADENYLHYTTNFNIRAWNYEAAIITEGVEILPSAPTEFNFTFADPTPMGGLTDYLTIVFTMTPGIWVNLSIQTGNVNSFTVIGLQDYDGWQMQLGNAYLAETKTQAGSEFAYRFGVISETVKLQFMVTRSNHDEGWFALNLDELSTTTITSFGVPGLIAPTPVGGDATPLIIGLGIGAAAIIVVVVIVIIRKRRAF